MAYKARKKEVSEVIENEQTIEEIGEVKPVVTKTEKTACGDCKYIRSYGSAVCRTCVIYKV